MKRMDSGNPDEQAFHQLNTRKKSKESGQAAVEMALMLPLLLLLIFGMLEMGWLATTRQTMDAITREATRAGTVASSTTAATSAVNSAITSKKPAYMKKAITVTVTFSKPASFKDGDITVTTSYDLPPLTPLTSFLAPAGTYHIVSTYTMKVG